MQRRGDSVPLYAYEPMNAPLSANETKFRSEASKKPMIVAEEMLPERFGDKAVYLRVGRRVV